MAVVIASKGTYTTGSASASLAVDAPASISENDLLVGFFSTNQNPTITQPTGWTSLGQTSSSNKITTCFAYKIATVADESATDYTFSHDFTPISGMFLAGYIIRITGHKVSAPITNSSISSGFSQDATTTTITPSANSLLLYVASVQPEALTVSVSGYSIATSDPTWNEEIDDFSVTSTPGYGIASATRPEATATGAGSATLTVQGSVDRYWVSSLISVDVEPDANVDADVLSLTSSVQAPTITGDSNVTADVVTITSSLPAPTVTTQTVDWTYESRPPASTWTIEDQI